MYATVSPDTLEVDMGYLNNVNALADKRGVIHSARGLYEPQLGISEILLRGSSSSEPVRVTREPWNSGIRLFLEEQAETLCDLQDLSIKGSDFNTLLARAQIYLAEYWTTDLRDDISRFVQLLRESIWLQIIPKKP